MAGAAQTEASLHLRHKQQRGHFTTLGVPPEELRFSRTLVNGQAFGWVPLDVLVDDDIGDGRVKTSAATCSTAVGTGDAQWWLGALPYSSAEAEGLGAESYCVIVLKETEDDCAFRVERGDVKRAERALRDYLRLDQRLVELSSIWEKADQHFQAKSVGFHGIRLLRQPPVETLFSFICSQNNHISRISSMVRTLRSVYGEPLGTFHEVSLHTFPTLRQLATCATESALRDLRFGYRAKYIVSAAQQLHAREEGGGAWLMGLRDHRHYSRDDVQRALLALPGVGRKVADCVALFSLDRLDCIPVDTHVWQIATRDYRDSVPRPVLECKSMTPTVYTLVGDFFRALFGEHAGWAHSVLFTADLKAFSTTAATKKMKVGEKPQDGKRRRSGAAEASRTTQTSRRKKRKRK